MHAKEVLRRYADEILPEFAGIDLTDVNQRGNFGNSPLKVASTRGNIEEIEALFAGGANVNAKGEDGYTALHHAASQGHVAAVIRLLQAGALPDLVNDDCRTPRDLAVSLTEDAVVAAIDRWRMSHG
jgi:ankyrin repeat protein